MSNVASKARFYLERSVPQLREWEEKEIFTQDEIRTIVEKRNNHEHRVLAPGNTPDDWSAYASWEKSLGSLVSKRCARLRLRHLYSTHATQARILKIYERSVDRHKLARQLWIEFLDYTAKVRAAKRWRRTMTSAPRLMPHDSGLWVMAARRSAAAGDMASARSMFMRGCRFCTGDATVWVEYAKCEMEWLKKMWLKKKTGTKDAMVVVQETQNEDDDRIDFGDDDDEDVDENRMILRDDEMMVEKEKPKVFTEENTDKLKNSPAMDGAIPMAIFDISQKQPFYSAEVAETFFNIFGGFAMMEIGGKLLQHVLDAMQTQYPGSAATCFCYIRQPVVAVSPLTADFPRGLREVFARLKSSVDTTNDKAKLGEKMGAWVDRILAAEGLDPAIVTVLQHMKSIST